MASVLASSVVGIAAVSAFGLGDRYESPGGCYAGNGTDGSCESRKGSR